MASITHLRRLLMSLPHLGAAFYSGLGTKFLRRARRHKGVIDLGHAPRNRQRIACDPTRLVRRQEHRDRRYIVRLSGPPERRPRDILLLEIAADDARSMCALSFDRAWIDRVDPNFPRTQLLRQHAGHRVDRAFRGGVDDRIRWIEITCHRADIDETLPPSSPKSFAASCVASSRPNTLMLKCR